MRKVTIIAVLLLAAGCAAHGAAPLNETSGYTPEAVQQLVTGRVYVRKGLTGWTAARYFRPGGGFDFCGVTAEGRLSESRGTWTVAADSRGRANWRLQIGSKRGRLYVPHYDPESGELKFRRRDGRGNWVTGMRGWLQASWPKVMAERCPGLAAGVPVDERQTAMTLAGLRRQTPDAPLKNLARPLPLPVGKQSAAPASGALHGSSAAGAADDGAASASGGSIDPRPQLSDELIAGAKERELAFMGPDYADRRFMFFGEGVKAFYESGNLAVLDLDGNLVADEGFDGTWRWAEGRLEIRVRGDRRVHSIAWRDLARVLGMTALASGDRG